MFVRTSLTVMNGVEATRNIRALGFKLPMVAVTGNGHEDDVAAFSEAGVDKILLKPASRAALQSTLKDFLPKFNVLNSAVTGKEMARSKRATT